jgi:hypothetical protein
MFVAFSRLSVPFKTSERPAAASYYAIQSEHTKKQLKVVLLSVVPSYS